MTKRDPFTTPFCNPTDLGLSIPNHDHAVSVCLPTWQDVIGYEEQDSRILDELECGYPRFVAHPLVAELFNAAAEEFAKNGESTLVFPTLTAAWRCADFAKNQGAGSVRLESYGWNGLTVLIVKEKDYPLAWKGWQHIGEIVSSRQAEAALLDAPLPEKALIAGKKADQILRERIAAGYQGVTSKDVFLFSSGMGAISAIHRVVMKLRTKLPTIQLEFPYLDALKVQQKCNPVGVVNFSNTTDGGLTEITDFFNKGNRAAAVFTEVPSNPLLKTPNLAEIAPILHQHGVPLIIDDTVATSLNVNVIQVADAITTSLTKSFSGEGDVAAGSLVLNPQSPFYEQFKTELPAEEEASPLFCLDASTLEINSRHFCERLMAMNENTREVIEILKNHPGINQLWHPSVGPTEYYDRVKATTGGYGALFSMTLKGGEAKAAKFYDHLRISKGPSLGTNFSLACPYTLLAHYTELDWAQSCGVPRDLIRIWIGLEEPNDLVHRFEEALK